jgi:hypothetical protein
VIRQCCVASGDWMTNLNVVVNQSKAMSADENVGEEMVMFNNKVACMEHMWERRTCAYVGTGR